MSSREIIDHLYNGDLEKMREAFHQTILPEVSNVLEVKRLEVAAQMVGEPKNENA